MAPMSASRASARIDDFSRPPDSTSPRPRCRWGPRPSSRATSASTPMLTVAARSLAISPSGRWGNSEKIMSVTTSPSTASPRNSNRSLFVTPPCSKAYDRCVSESRGRWGLWKRIWRPSSNSLPTAASRGPSSPGSGVSKLFDLNDLTARVVAALPADSVGHLGRVALGADGLPRGGKLPGGPAVAGGGSRFLSLGQWHLGVPLQLRERASQWRPAQVLGFLGVAAVGAVEIGSARGAQPTAVLVVQGSQREGEHDHVAEHGLEVDVVVDQVVAIVVLGSSEVVRLVQALLEAAIVVDQASRAEQVHRPRHRTADGDALGHAVGRQVDLDWLVLPDRPQRPAEAGDRDGSLDTKGRVGARHQLGYIENKPRHDHQPPGNDSRHPPKSSVREEGGSSPVCTRERIQDGRNGAICAAPGCAGWSRCRRSRRAPPSPVCPGATPALGRPSRRSSAARFRSWRALRRRSPRPASGSPGHAPWRPQ